MGSYLVREAYLLCLDGDDDGLRRGDVLIEGAHIADVAPHIDAPGAEVIDGRGRIAMPGFVDTHRHMWAAMLRGGACYGDLHDYFVKVVFTYGAAFTPEDTYRSVRFGLAESVDGGITSMHAWEHNIQTPAHARAALQAMRESGAARPLLLRAVERPGRRQLLRAGLRDARLRRHPEAARGAVRRGGAPPPRHRLPRPRVLPRAHLEGGVRLGPRARPAHHGPLHDDRRTTSTTGAPSPSTTTRACSARTCCSSTACR